ncbi:MAG: hypothetical protein CMA16_03555 [Euryarchaeota archaeon]|nr:hypothetical protein [Euryarchaeota archaeon]|tara:strand:+ start:5526 stop:6185 length:660 start_codon:yes stop_codon:yes gene_type:complete
MESDGAEVVASGDVRFTFRSDETDVNVIIEGKKGWVEGIVDELGLSDVGLTMPIGVQVRSKEPDAISEDIDEEDTLKAPTDMGPEPDPSRIPVVKRPIGALNVEIEIEKIGLEPPSQNDVFELMDAFSELDEPRPIQGEMSVDPMAEAWLKELMRLIVREGGRTALATEMIEEVASTKLGGRTGVELSVWLESLFAAGKLVKIHGGDSTGWGPSPRWLG